MLARSLHLERVAGWLVRQDQELQVRLARELVTRCRALNREIGELDQQLEQRTTALAPALLDLPGLRRDHGREAARRDRPGRPLPLRRTTRPPQRRRAPRSKLRPDPAPPPRPRRQPTAQRRPLPDRDHPSPRPRTSTRLPRTKTGRRKKPPRSDPLPQTPPRPRRLPNTQNKPRLDIAATLAQASAAPPGGSSGLLTRRLGVAVPRLSIAECYEPELSTIWAISTNSIVGLTP